MKRTQLAIAISYAIQTLLGGPKYSIIPTPKADEDREDFKRFLADGGVENYKAWRKHPGNPINQDDNESCWVMVRA